MRFRLVYIFFSFLFTSFAGASECFSSESQFLDPYAGDRAQIEYLLNLDIEALIDIYIELRNMDPGRQFLYVTVGSSPVAVFAFLKSIDPKIRVVNFPISGLSNFSEQNRESLNQRFRDFFSNPILQDHRQIVFIDYSFTGRTMIHLVQEAKLFFATTSIQIKGLALGKHSSFYEPYIPYVDPLKDIEGVKSYNLAGTNFIENLHARRYKAYAQYRSSHFSLGVAVLNPLFDVFRQMMQQKVHDENLDKLSSYQNFLRCREVFK